MAGMPMDAVQVQPAADQKAEPEAAKWIVADCTHCVSHSQLPASPATLRDADQSKRNDKGAAPPLTSERVLTPGLFIASALPRQHGPPGATSASARHVLINVFRI